MSFKGTLKEFKVPDILQIISMQQKSGLLTFTREDAFVSLSFDKGNIVSVDAFPKEISMRVGNVLVKRGEISQDILEQALVIQRKTGQRIGEILFLMKVIDKEAIKKALRTQAVEIVLSLFKWKKGEYKFVIKDILGGTLHYLKPPIVTDGLIMEGVQMMDEWPAIESVVNDSSLVFYPVTDIHKTVVIIDEEEEKQDSEEKIFISESETEILKYINGKNKVSDILDMGFTTEYKLYKTIYNLEKKNLIKKRHIAHIDKKKEEEDAFELMKAQAKSSCQSFRKVSLIISLVLIFWLILSFTNPFSPLKKESNKISELNKSYGYKSGQVNKKR